MANYYTYGKVPTAEETVFGPLSQGYAEGGEVDEPVPADRPLPDEPYYSEPPAMPESSGFNMGALDELFANLRKTEQLQKLALEPGLLQQGFTGTSGVTTPPSGAGIYATPTRAAEPAVDFEVTPEMAGALQQVARPADITAAEREAVTSNPRVQALQQISDKLKADDFAGAFDTALAAERNLGGDFVGNIIDSNKMRELRGPMNAEEITKFYNEMPQKVFEERYLGPGNEFKKEQAIERNIAALGGEAGYVDPMLGVKKEETLLSKLPIKELAALAAAAMGATAIPGLFGAGAGSGAGAGAGAAGAGGAGAGAAGAAGGAGALTGVVPTGLVAGTTAANLALPVFTVTAGGGLTAAQLAAAAAAAGGAGALTGGSSAATPTTTTTPTPEAPLDEVVVQATRPPAIPPAAVVAPTVGALPTEPPVVEPPLEEVVVEAQRPVEPEISVPPPISPPSAPVEPPVPEAPLEEVVVETTRPVEPEIVPPPVVTPPTSPVDTAFPEGPVEEVVVETTKPTEPPIVTPPIVTTPTTPVDTAFPEGPVEEVVVETTKPTPEKPIIPPVVVPTTTPVDIPKEPPKVNEPTSPTDKIKDLLAKYGDLETLLKLLGALGSAGSGGKGTTAPTAPTGGMGGALPKYTLTRKQLSPDIDYYTYGTRPEAKFFEQGFQLEKPTQPAGPQPEGPPAGPLSTPAALEVDRPIGYLNENKSESLSYIWDDGTRHYFPQRGTLEEAYADKAAREASAREQANRPVVFGPQEPTYAGPTEQTSLISEEDPERYREMIADMQSFLTVTPREGATEADLEKLRQQTAQTTGKAMGGLTGYAKGGSKESRYVDGPGSGRDDKIPALLSDGEYVIDAETLALLGDGSTKEGARRMDKFRAKIRQHKGRALSRGRISPNAKSPEKYMGGGLS